jgi:hypothetical protein
MSVGKASTQKLINILVRKNEGELAYLENELTIPQALEGTSLKKLIKIIDQKNTVKALVFLTTRLSDNFNVGKKFTEEQAIVMAFDLIEVFGYETLEDVVLMFKYARQGKIGDGKDFKLDSQTVFHKWIPEYLNLKAEHRENEHIKIKKQIDTLEKNTNFYELKAIQKSQNQKTERVIAYIEKITKGIDRPTLEKLISEWNLDPVKKEYIALLKKKRLDIKSSI